jgi:predicted membrane-bound mannosyltransferase
MNRSFIFLGQVKSQLWRSSALKKVALGMIVIGVILRLFQYSLNRSLWLDESFIALEVVNKSFLELLGPLNYYQVAPIGFLFTEKAFLLLLGNNEYILRLFPLVAGIVSLFLFYYIARHCIREPGALIAFGLFSLSAHLVYYSSEVKQYSSDVTIALLLLAVTMFIRSKKFTNRSIVFFGAIGGIAVWFSLPSVFVLAGIGCTVSLFSLARKEWSTHNRLL